MYKQLTYSRGQGLEEYTYPIYQHDTNLPSTNLVNQSSYSTRLKHTSSSTFTPSFSLAKSLIKDTVNYTSYIQDLKDMPDYYKNIGCLGQSIIDSSSKLFSRVDKVDDFESCAQYYHKNGYLVNEYISNGDNVNDSGKTLFQYINTRHFYNVLKLSEVDVHLNDTIESEELTRQIALRLMKGLRLWNYDAVIDGSLKITIGDFTYDNVEKDYIKKGD